MDVKLGHTVNQCTNEVVMSEAKPYFPMYGPWLRGVRLRPLNNMAKFVVEKTSRN